jgi:predicted transcriptional regulator of viral defense system
MINYLHFVSGKPMTNIEKVIFYLETKGVIRTNEAIKLGVTSATLQRMCRRGFLRRVSRGIYIPVDADIDPFHSFAEVAKRVPEGIICLLSALSFHELTTQNPYEVWVAIKNKARKPAMDELPLRIIRFSGKALEYGVEKQLIEGIEVKITTPAKTVADCFKFRNKIGVNVAVEAMKDFREKRKGTMADLWQAAKICRVSNVMKPYFDVL